MMQKIIPEYKDRLKNMITRRGDNNVMELSLEVIQALESEYQTEFSIDELMEFDAIADEYYKLFNEE